jgi:hypothetical protein
VDRELKPPALIIYGASSKMRAKHSAGDRDDEDKKGSVTGSGSDRRSSIAPTVAGGIGLVATQTAAAQQTSTISAGRLSFVEM